MDFTFSASLWEWRGPAPYYFLSVPEDLATEISEAAKHVSYGWGMIPIKAEIGGTLFKTSMFAKNGTYVVPVKNAVRLPLNLKAGDLVEVSFELGS